MVSKELRVEVLNRAIEIAKEMVKAGIPVFGGQVLDIAIWLCGENGD